MTDETPRRGALEALVAKLRDNAVSPAKRLHAAETIIKWGLGPGARR